MISALVKRYWLQLVSQGVNLSDQHWLRIAPCRQPLSAETRHVFLLVKLMTFHVELRT